MAQTDILMPAYRGAHKRTEAGIRAMMNFSACKCYAEGLDRLRGRQKFNEVEHKKFFHHPSECPQGKHDILLSPPYHCAVVHWSRNELVMQMRPDAEWALFCDDDIVPEADYLDRLLSHGKDIVSGLCTRRTDPPEPTLRLWSDAVQNYEVVYEWPKENELIEIDAVGTGFLLVNRKVFKDMAEAYHPAIYKKNGNGWWFENIKGPPGGEWGEDISFSWKAQRIGYRVFCDTSVMPAHMGDYNYTVEDFYPWKEQVIQRAGTGARIVERQIPEPVGA